MPDTTHDLAPHSLPRFIAGPDGSDPLFTAVVVLAILLFMGLGVLYFRLHAVPERIAHKHNNTQLQAIAVLAVLALFTHNNVFWVAALLLSIVRFPDFLSPINSIAESLAALARRDSPPDKAGQAPAAGETATEQHKEG